MHARVVRFTDVDPSQVEKRLEGRVEEGQPEGVNAKSVQILVDRDQGSAVVVQLFESAEDMSSSEAALSAMDPAETPGTRLSVDRCELVMELNA